MSDLNDLCGMTAHGFVCVLPRSHNRGSIDIPENHQRATNGIRSSGTMYGWALWREVLCVECPACAFTFDAHHTDTSRAGYTCPNCEHRSATS